MQTGIQGMRNATLNETWPPAGAGVFRPAYDSCLIVLAFCIVAINVLVVMLFVRKDYLRTKTNCFLVSLALSDLMTGLLSIPLYLLCPVTYDYKVCITSAVFYRCVAVSTMAHIQVVTLERYVAVMYPMRYYRMVTKRRVCCVIALVWVYSLLYSFIQLTWLDLAHHNLTNAREKEKFETPYQITGLLLCFTVPLFVMLFCFTRMFIVIRRQVKNIRKQAELAVDPRNRSIATDKRALVIFASMLGIFVVCWLSWYITLFQVQLGKNAIIPEKLADVLDFFRFGTSLFNPLLYTFLKHDFRRAVVSVCPVFLKTPTSQPRRESNALRMTLMTETNGKIRVLSNNDVSVLKTNDSKDSNGTMRDNLLKSKESENNAERCL